MSTSSSTLDISPFPLIIAKMDQKSARALDETNASLTEDCARIRRSKRHRRCDSPDDSDAKSSNSSDCIATMAMAPGAPPPPLPLGFYRSSSIEAVSEALAWCPPSATPALLCARYRRHPTEKMVADHDMELVSVVRASDLEGLGQLAAAGRSMDAATKHGESLLHRACRSGNAAVVQRLLQLGASALVVDDLGRTPLHDACWTAVPNLEVAGLLLAIDPMMVCLLDARGNLPLDYARVEHRAVWNAFFATFFGHGVPANAPADQLPPPPPEAPADDANSEKEFTEIMSLLEQEEDERKDEKPAFDMA